MPVPTKPEKTPHYQSKTRRKTISISRQNEHLIALAEQRADDLGLSFSNYLMHLVKTDLQKSGKIPQSV